MDRRQLEYFLAVVDQNGFTNAAHALHVAQPSLSQAIKSLEREFGTELFTRLPRAIRLTPAGEALVGAARQTMRDFEAARAAVLSVAGLERGRLDITAPSTMSADPLAPLLAQFHARHPGVFLRVLGAPSTEVLDLVRSGEAEIAVTWADERPANLLSVDLPPSEVYVVLPPGSPSYGGVLPRAAIEELELVVGSETRFRLQALLDSLGVHPRIVAETAHRESMLWLVISGVGAALLPAAVAKHAAALGAVVCRPDPPIPRRTVLVYRDGPQSAAARAFVSLAGQHAREAAQDEPGAVVDDGPAADAAAAVEPAVGGDDDRE
jgi:DNA-binding transcriptional LysR family regulator